MKNRHFALFFLAIVTTVAILFSACKKINASTELGGGLIPPVDNITTFDTSISVQTFNDTFGLAKDSQFLGRTGEHFLGRINSDPFFGKTDARLFLELKPAFFPFAFLNKKDSLSIDSVVLVLNYLETYGDSTTAQTVNVYELDPGNNFRSDTIYLIRTNNLTYSSLLGAKTFLPGRLDDSVFAYKDTTSKQLRIKLDNSFGARLLNYDSTAGGAYSGDSAFKTYFRGFALQSMSAGNAVMGFDLTGTNTKLAIYYKYNKGGPGIIDTSVAYFSCTPTCATANYVKRDYTGTPALASVSSVLQAPVVYIQNTPGTFATIKIPDLLNVSNRVIHRAELIVEELYHPSDTIFRDPDFLYLDASDPSITTHFYQYRTIPYDLGFTPSGALNLPALGIAPINTVDGFGNNIRTWKFNISRYVQHVLTRTQSLYDLRLLAPFDISEQFGIPPGTDITTNVFVNSSIVKGRVRLGGGNHPTQRMRLRLVYSKL